MKIKKYSPYIVTISLTAMIFFGFLYWRGSEIDEENKEVIVSDTRQEKVIDISNTIVECKNGEQYLGKDLISKNINFQLIGSNIFYKGEELERICNPSMGEYDYEAEPSFNIIPAYI